MEHQEKNANSTEEVKPRQQSQILRWSLWTLVGIGIVLHGTFLTLGFLHNSTNVQIAARQQEIQDTTNQLRSHEEFSRYLSLSGAIARPPVHLGDFLSSLETTLESFGKVTSIDIAKDDNHYATTLLVESAPPLSIIAGLLEQTKNISQIKEPLVDSISTSQNQLGQFVYSYPISFTITENGDTATQQ